MSDIGICEYCKYKDIDMIQNPCFGCSAQMGTFEFDMSEHDKRIRAEVIDEVKELMKKYIEFENIDIFVETLRKLREQK